MVNKLKTECSKTRLSPWVELVETTVYQGQNKHIFHSFDQADYVTIVAVTKRRTLLVVRQFRPAVNEVTLELPGGLMDLVGERPEDCVLRELHEETGFSGGENFLLLGRWWPDTGRLNNSLWAYFVEDVEAVEDWRGEKGVDFAEIELTKLSEMIVSGEFRHALHIAIIGAAVMRGLLPELVQK
ncbi:MAG: NUDIX hydrolase [Pseudomonadota bacterium]|nr:NUDIX hydrolase [Pseudomonadota bacterium]